MDNEPLPLDFAIPDPLRVLRPRRQLQALATQCVFVLDTNALLAPYLVGADSLREIGGVLRQLANTSRLYVPAQALREFARNRADRARDLVRHVREQLSRSQGPAELDIPMLEGNELYANARDAYVEAAKATAAFRNAVKAVREHLEAWAGDDPVTRLYEGLFNKEMVAEAQMGSDELRSDARRRQKYHLPPGYKDQGKPDEGIGDVVIWHSVIAVGAMGHDVIFVTDDQKADWMVRHDKEGLYPRPELIYEFDSKTAGREFLLARWPQFLALAGASKDVVEEADRVVANPPFAEVAPVSRVLTNAIAELRSLHKYMSTRGLPAKRAYPELFDSLVDYCRGALKQVVDSSEVESELVHEFRGVMSHLEWFRLFNQDARSGTTPFRKQLPDQSWDLAARIEKLVARFPAPGA